MEAALGNLLTAIALLGSPALGARAQTSPEALVLVHPAGDMTTVVATFHRTLPHDDVRGRLTRLGGLLGGRMDKVTVSDRSAPQTEGKRTSAPSQMTSAEALLKGGSIGSSDAFNLQPFLEVFGDLGTFEVLFVVQPNPAFAGLTRYDDGKTSVRLIQAGSPYRYAFTVRDPSGPRSKLPLRQAAQEETEETQKSAGGSAARRSTQGLPIVLGLGIGAGVLVYAWLRRRVNQREGAGRGDNDR